MIDSIQSEKNINEAIQRINQDDAVDDNLSAEECQILSTHLNKFWELPPDSLEKSIELTFEALTKFDEILSETMLPAHIFVKLHNYVLELITLNEIPNNLIIPALNIIVDISSNINEDIPSDFYQGKLFPAIFRFLPDPHAIDAIAALISSNLIAANSFLSVPGAYDKIAEFINSNNEDQIISALSFFQAIVSHPEIIPEVPKLINNICSFIIETSNSDLQEIAFRILSTAANTDFGVSEIVTNLNFHEMFLSAQNRTSFSSSLYLLRRIATQMIGEIPFIFFFEHNLLQFVIQGLDMETTRYISAGIIYTLSVDCSDAVEFFASFKNGKIVMQMLDWHTQDQKLWTLGLRTLSMFCLNSQQICQALVNEDGTSVFLDLVLEWLDVIDDDNDNDDFRLDLVKTIAQFLPLAQDDPKVRHYFTENQETLVTELENFMNNSDSVIYKLSEMIINAVSNFA